MSFLLAGPVFSQNIISNEQLLADASRQAAAILFDSLKIAAGTFNISSTSGIDEIVADGIIAALQKKGYITENAAIIPAESTLSVNARLSGLKFSYVKGSTRGFWKKPYIKRKLSGQIAINLSGKANYIGFRDISYEDQILPEQATIVASPKYNQLAPEIPRLGATRFVEPAAVAATVGGLIYLFFASR